MRLLRVPLRWLTTPTGLLLVVAAVCVAVGVLVERVGDLVIVGVGLFVAVIARAVTMHDQRLEAVTAELARANDARVAEFRGLSDDVRAMTAVLEERVGALSADTGRLLEEVAVLDDAVGSAGQRTEEISNELAEQVTRIRERITAAVERERSVRSLSIARMTAPSSPPSRVLVLMTLHRSGSTRLFDIVRTHPGTTVASTADVWARLGLRGRRYPVAFSDLRESWRAIEIEQGKGATIPEMPVADLTVEGSTWFIEKAHPQFCDFDAGAFAARVAELRAEGVDVQVAYGIRSPLDAMWSMVAFQSRQPTWYAFLATADIPDWIRRSLATMAEMHDLVPGIVIDHADLPDGPSLQALARQLAPGWDAADVRAWTRFAADATTPDRPAQAGTGFLGGSAAREEQGPSRVWADLDDVIARAEDAYLRLQA